MQRGDGEVGLGLWRHRTRVAEDAHHLQERQAVPEAGPQGTSMQGSGHGSSVSTYYVRRPRAGLSNVTALCGRWELISSVFPAQGAVSQQELQKHGRHLCHGSVPYGLV